TTVAGILGSILTETPAKPSELNPAVPALVDRLILKALEKDRESRYQSVASLAADLEAWQRSEAAAALRRLRRKPHMALPAAIMLLAVLAAAVWFAIQSHRARWARNVALPEIGRLVDKEDFDSAFRLARRAERYLGDDPELLRLRRHYQIQRPVHTEPPGA